MSASEKLASNQLNPPDRSPPFSLVWKLVDMMIVNMGPNRKWYYGIFNGLMTQWMPRPVLPLIFYTCFEKKILLLEIWTLTGNFTNVKYFFKYEKERFKVLPMIDLIPPQHLEYATTHFVIFNNTRGRQQVEDAMTNKPRNLSQQINVMNFYLFRLTFFNMFFTLKLYHDSFV